MSLYESCVKYQGGNPLLTVSSFPIPDEVATIFKVLIAKKDLCIA